MTSFIVSHCGGWNEDNPDNELAGDCGDERVSLTDSGRTGRTPGCLGNRWSQPAVQRQKATHTHSLSHTLPQGWLMSDRAQGLLLQTPELLEEELRVVIDKDDNGTATGSFF